MQKSTKRFCKGNFMSAGLILQLCFLICGQPEVLAAQSYDMLDETVRIKAGSTSVINIVTSLQQQTGYTYVYDPEYLQQCHVKAMDAGTVKLSAILKWLDEQAPLEIIYTNRTIVVRKGVQEKSMQTQPGYIRGRIVDSKNEPLPGVTIKLQNGKGTMTQIDGTYNLEVLPGRYVVEYSYISYNTRRITDVIVKEKGITPLNIVMQPSSSALKEVVVTANYKKASVEGLYALQKNNAAVSDGISAEQISLTPDNNAAQVLKRISGLTVQEDKFVTVRGLSERYNNVILNGANLPSTEPNRRNFSFDVIPSGLIDNIIVNKTATPDMPAEFAGGLVQVNTRDIPAENYASVTVGSGINTNSAGKPFYATKRGNNDYLGLDAGNRNWWNDKWKADTYRQFESAGNNQKTSEMNAAIPNNWGLYKYKYAPVQNYQLSLGRRIKLKDELSSLGITLAATYRHEENRLDETRYQPAYYYYNDAHTYNFNTALGAVANVGFQTKGHKIVLKNLYNRRFSNETNVYYGQDFNSIGGNMKYYTNVTLINTLLQNRLEGEHLLHKHLKFDWSADYITIDRDQPDTRSSNGYQSGGPKGYYWYILNDQNGYMTEGLNIFNSGLDERRKNVSGNVSIPFNIGNAKQLVKVGYAGAFRDADFASVSLRTFNDPKGDPTAISKATFGLSDYQLHTPELFTPGLLTYRLSSATGIGYNGEDYTGKQQLHAAYAMVDVNFLKHFRFIGGVRMEDNYMEINGISFDKATGLPRDSITKYNRRDWLPSFNLVYNLTPVMNFRVAYSKTLSRADFRERSPFIYYEFKERNTYRGSVNLQDAGITNMDIRYEYYPGPGEVISVSGFYKKFDSPVELVAAQGTPGLIYFYFNLKESTSKGIEIDVRKSLGFIAPAATWLKKIYISGNGSWMKANVSYSTEALKNAADGLNLGGSESLPGDSRNRPLQGLSPYVINGGIGYFGDVLGLNVSYNRYGKRIVNGGFFPVQDQYENPRDVIDVQLSASFLKKKLQVRWNISDLLQQDYIIYQNVGTGGGPTASGGGSLDVNNETRILDNPNNDPKGTGYNKKLDYTYHRWFKGRNLSLNITYNF